MKNQQRSRLRSSHRLLGRLAAYCAGSASLTAVEANAAVVFTNLELSPVTIADGEFQLDLNLDGEFDFSLIQERRRVTWTDSSGYVATATTNRSLIRGHRQNKVLANAALGNALNLQAGDVIATTAANGSQQPLLASSQRVCSWSGCDRWTYGSFTSYDSHGYLGLQFSLPESGLHSGWLEVEALYADIVLYGFAYETEPGVPIRAGDTGVSANIPGDTNGDSKVDLEDLNNVRNNFGAAGDGILGDTNDDDLVDLEDLNAVRNNFGAGNPVPEPPSLVLLAAGAAGLGAWRRKRGQKACVG